MTTYHSILDPFPSVICPTELMLPLILRQSFSVIRKLCIPLLLECQAYGIHTMPLVCRRRVPLSLENMAEVTSTI